MPKGRAFVPQSHADGIWFTHRGLPEPDRLSKETSTSTGIMLASPFKSQSAQYPPKPPQPYVDKNSNNFKNSNSFSAHDNRHSFQDHGVYFGDGGASRTLGKNLTATDRRQHATDKDYLKHYGRQVVNYNYDTNYHTNYRWEPTERPPTTRRFPKMHKEGDSSLAKLNTSTTSWHTSPEVPYKTPTQVLAVAQEPFLPKNTWKYSYHGKSKCYPPYDRINPRKPFATWTVQGHQNQFQNVLSS